MSHITSAISQKPNNMNSNDLQETKIIREYVNDYDELIQNYTKNNETCHDRINATCEYATHYYDFKNAG